MTRSIISIDVVGSCPHAGIGLSGRGLKLGDSLIDARRIYLLQSYFGTTPSDTSPGPFRWSDWAPTLQVDFDKSGKVNHMKLTWQCVQTCF